MDTTTNSQLQTVADDLGADAALVKAAVTAYKTGGKSALISTLSAALPLAEKEFADVKAALPAIKAGYKTTEFWLVLTVPAANGIYLALTGKVLPIDLNATLGAVVAVYTVVRGLVKSQAPAAPIAAAK